MLSSFDELPTFETARLDRLTIEASGWRIAYYSTENLDTFLLYLQLPPRMRASEMILPDRQLNEGRENAGWAFRNLKHPHPFLSTLNPVRLNRRGLRKRECGLPLFGGEIRFKKRSPNEHSSQFCHIGMDLALNPTRFADCHPSGPPFFPYMPHRYYRFREESLDGNDNLFRNVGLSRYNNLENWIGARDACIPTVLDGIGDEIERAANQSGCSFNRETLFFNLGDAEVYWEKKSEDALAELRRLTPKLLEIGRESRIENYPNSGIQRNRNCPSTTIRLATGLKLRVYAKTLQRIRFEVVYKIKDYHGETSSANDVSELMEKLERLTTNANERLLPIWRRISEHPTPCPDGVTLEEFFRKLNQSVLFSYEANETFSILRDRRCFNPTSERTRKISENLRNKGILDPANLDRKVSQSGYPLSPPYLDLFIQHFPLPSCSPPNFPSM